MAQSFVSYGYKYGNIDLKNVFPNCNHVHRAIDDIKEEQTQDIVKTFQDSIKRRLCSATIESQTFNNSLTHSKSSRRVYSIF